MISHYTDGPHGPGRSFRVFLGLKSIIMSLHITAKDISIAGSLIQKMPSVALVLPFDPKMTPRQEMDKTQRTLLERVEKELLSHHGAEDAMPVIRKLRQLVRGLNYSTLRKSIAVFVSPEVAKVCYMDMEVEERVFVDDPFRVRDLAQCRKKDTEYLVLVLSAKESKMYRGTGNHLQLIKSNVPQSMYAYLNEVPERVGNFSDPEARREVMLNKFLHHMDQGLGAVLKVYALPVFVIGPSRVIGHFSSITHHEKNIVGYIYKNCVEEGGEKLMESLQPELANWQKLKQRMLQRQIEKALEAGRLVGGMEEVRKAAVCRNARLLVIEREGSGGDRTEDGQFYHDGIIDEIVEKVLENGGAVEEVDEGLLADHGPVVIIRYY